MGKQIHNIVIHLEKQIKNKSTVWGSFELCHLSCQECLASLLDLALFLFFSHPLLSHILFFFLYPLGLVENLYLAAPSST